MQAWVRVQCAQCGDKQGETIVDTAEDSDDVKLRLDTIILAHRLECKYYRQEGRKA